KIIIDLEDEVMSLLEKEKANLEIIESLKSKGFESSENVSSELENQTENDRLVVGKRSCDSNNIEINLKRKRRKRKSSKQNVKQVNNDVSPANSDFVYFSDLVTFSSVRRPNHSSVVWKKKRSSNTSNVDLSTVNVLKLNKNVKRYSRKDLLACNNSHIGETSSASVSNDTMNVSCNPRMCDLLDDYNFFIFDDVNVRIFPGSKMPFRKKPRESMNVHSKSNSNKYLLRTMHKWHPKLQLLAEPQTSSLKPYVLNVILEKIIIDLENEVVSLLEKDKANLKTIESLKSKGFESSENVISESENQSENDCLEVEKECDKVENSKVIAPGMFKLSVSQSVSPILMSKSSCDSKNVESKLKGKRRKRKSTKQNDKQVNNDVLHANRDFVHFSDLDTFSSIRRPKHNVVIWKKK
nr:hypothetical protein [Tanacetum cinerariifolium]